MPRCKMYKMGDVIYTAVRNDNVIDIYQHTTFIKTTTYPSNAVAKKAINEL